MTPFGRHFRRRQVLGANDRCCFCGEANPDALIKLNKSLLEIHHPLGRVHAPDVKCTACFNCHKKLSARQYDDGVPLSPQLTRLERLIAVAKAAGSHLRAVGEGLLSLADGADEVIKGLDRDHPEWRKKPWA